MIIKYFAVTFFFTDFIHRETKHDGRTERISIDMDHQLELEFPPILCGSDKLQRKYFLMIGIIMMPNMMRIVTRFRVMVTMVDFFFQLLFIL